jgi:hypothetical protein
VKKTNGPALEKDFRDFIDLCNRFSIRYLVVGGFAVSIHGYPRGTKDLDICIEASDENASKMISVLDEFGMGALGLTKEDFLRRGFFTQLGYEPVRIDIMNDIDGVNFEEAWQNRRTVEYEGQPIHFIGYHELLRMKALAGRPQDIADIAKLKARNKGK